MTIRVARSSHGSWAELRAIDSRRAINDAERRVDRIFSKMTTGEVSTERAVQLVSSVIRTEPTATGEFRVHARLRGERRWISMGQRYLSIRQCLKTTIYRDGSSRACSFRRHSLEDALWLGGRHWPRRFWQDRQQSRASQIDCHLCQQLALCDRSCSSSSMLLEGCRSNHCFEFIIHC